jgi:hypothetical protein
MTTTEFNKVIENRLLESRRILVEKAKEYAKGDDDRLHNFNRAAEITGQSRERCLFGFALKHLVSVMDIIEDIDKGNIPTHELTSEKIGDLVNYLLLLEASITDKRHGEPLF